MFCIFLLSGCKKLKEEVGFTVVAPNEYAVQKLKPLDTPPHYDLPEPTGTGKQ